MSILAGCAPAELGAQPRGAAETSPLEAAEGTPGRIGSTREEAAAPAPEPMQGMLEFFGIGPGERIADLGTGAGYSIDEMADAVGATGVVYARHDPRVLVAAAAPGARTEREGALPANIIVMETSDAAPFSLEAKSLDLVTLLFAYHDLVGLGRNRQSFNRAVFDALAPDRFYIIAEHAAPVGAGVDAAREGRIEERIVRADVEAAGFVFVEAAQLLPSTARKEGSGAAPPSQYLLKFRRPR